MHLGALPPAFAGLDPADTSEASALLQPASLETGELLMEKGEEDYTMAFIVSGSVSLIDQNVRIGGATARDIIGEAELFAQIPRLATAIAASPTHLLVLGHEQWMELCERGNPAVYNIERFAYRRLLERLRSMCEGIADRSTGEHPTPHTAARRGGLMDRISSLFGGGRPPVVDARIVLGSSPAFHWAPSDVLSELSAFFRAERFSAGTIPARAGQIGDQVWVVVDGEVDLVIPVGEGGEIVGTVVAGQAFGDASMTQTPRPISAICRTDVLAVTIDGDSLEALFAAQDPVGSVFRQGMLRNLVGELAAVQQRFVALERRELAREQAEVQRTPVSTVWRG